MQQLLTKLAPFIKGCAEEKLVARISMPEENIYDLILNNKDEAVGIIQLLADGGMKMFGAYCEEGEPKETMTKDEVREVTEHFIQELFPESVSVLHLDSIVDLDVFYVLEYVQKDERFNLSMPNSGVVFYMYKNGVIMDMTNEMNGFTVCYPEAIIEAERAKEIYLADVKPELKIVRHGGEAYPKGDDLFVLVYDFINTVGIDVKMNGKKTTLQDLGVEKDQHSAIEEIVVEPVPIYSLVNLEGMQKIVESGNIEVWSTQTRAYYENNEDFAGEDPTDMDWGLGDAVKIMTDSERGTLRRLVTEPISEGISKFSLEAAYEQALRILFSQFPHAHLSFKRREDEPAVGDYDDEGGELPPYAFQFTFDRFEGEIQVLEESISITVSAFTGELVTYDATENAYEDFASLVKVIPMHAEKALALYENAFEMRLHWAKEFDNDGGGMRYELVYCSEFEGAGGHIHFIDANTLELWIADVDGLEGF